MLVSGFTNSNHPSQEHVRVCESNSFRTSTDGRSATSARDAPAKQPVFQLQWEENERNVSHLQCLLSKGEVHPVFVYMAFAVCRYILDMSLNRFVTKPKSLKLTASWMVVLHVGAIRCDFKFHTGLQTFICAARVTFTFYRVHHIVHKTSPVAHHSDDAILSIPVFSTALFNSLSPPQ